MRYSLGRAWEPCANISSERAHPIRLVTRAQRCANARRHHAFDQRDENGDSASHPQPGHAASLPRAPFPRGGSLAFFPTRARSTPRASRSSLPTIAIGRLVFVNCHPSDRSGAVFLADESGKVISAVRVADGLEVEVIAWRPRGAAETRYRVRVRSTGAEGWLPAENLRTVLIPLPPPAPPAAAALTPARATPIAGSRRRFGQHFDAAPARTASSSSPASGSPAPSGDDRGRRFGQHF